MRANAMACAIAVLMIAAPATAQVGIQNPDASTPTTLFFHLDANQDFPINTQPPDDRYAKAEVVGLTGITTSCVPEPTGQAGFVSQAFHTIYGFSTPGYVEYDFGENGGPRIHPERGLAEDVLLDTNVPMNLYWYLETQILGDSRNTPPETETVPIVVPQVVVTATMREGDDISVGAEAYNSGTVIAAGQSAAMDMRPDDANPHYYEIEGGKHLYEFVVPMSISGNRIPANEAFNIRIDVSMALPGCDSDVDSALMLSNVRMHTSPDFRPHVELATLNPVSIEYIHPQIVGDALVIHTAFSSPWGNYDVDESLDGIQVKITGPSDARSLTRTAFVQRHHEHNHHFQPVDVTYSWPFELDNAQPAEYTIDVSARNDQQTAMATGRALFDLSTNVGVGSDGELIEQVQHAENESPGAGVLMLLAAVAIGLAARRR